MVNSLEDLDFSKTYSYAKYLTWQYYTHGIFTQREAISPFLFPELSIILEGVFD